jgi:hypothetical protein
MTKEKQELPKYHGLNIHQRLHAVMKDIDYVQKEDKKVNGQYTFVSHDAVTAKCRKAFIENGIISVPTIINHEREWVLTKTKNGEIQKIMTTVEVGIEFINIDNPEDRAKTVSIGYGLDDQDKGLGKAYSYAVKYGYLKALGLETGDDPEQEIHAGVKPVNGAKNDKDTKAGHALGGAMSSGIDEETVKQMYDKALKDIAGADSLEKLKTVWAKINKGIKVFTPEQVADLEQAKEQAKQDIAPF